MEMILNAFPSLTAAYLFGSCAAGEELPESDADIALLFPHAEAKAAGHLAMDPLRFSLEKQLHRRVDLVNLRLVSTVFQKEIIATSTRVFSTEGDEADLFEALVLSLYGKLNEERAEILAALKETSRAYRV
jgi:uncharacterized protein